MFVIVYDEIVKIGLTSRFPFQGMYTLSKLSDVK